MNSGTYSIVQAQKKQEDIVNDMFQCCLNYHLHLRRYSYPDGEEKNKITNRLIVLLYPYYSDNERIKNIPKIQSLLSDPSKINALLSRHMSWFEIFLISLTFFITIPAMMLHSWYAINTVNFLKSKGEVFVEKLRGYVEEINQLQQLIDAQQKKECMNVQPQDQKAMNNTENEPILKNQSITTLTIYTPPLNFFVIDNENEDVPTPPPSPPIEPSEPEDSKPKLSGIPSIDFYLSGEYERILNDNSPTTGFFKSIFSVDYALRVTGKPIVIDTRLRKVESNIKPRDFTLDFYCKFALSRQTPITTTINVTTDFETPSPMDLVTTDDSESQNFPFVNSTEPSDCLFSSISSLVQSSISWFKPKRNFEIICQEAQNATGVLKPHVLYVEAFAHAQTNEERVFAIERIINALDKEKKYLEMIAPSGGGIYEEKRFQIIKESTEKYILQLPPYFRALSKDVTQIKRDFKIIYDFLREERMGEADYAFRHLKSYSAFIKHACPELVAMYHQLQGLFYVIHIPGYSILPIMYKVPSDEFLTKEIMYLYIQNKIIWCAFVTPENLIQRITIDPAELGEHAQHVQAYLEVKGGYPEGFYKEVVPIMFDVLKNKGYFQTNQDGLQPYITFCHFKRTYENLKKYNEATAQEFYEKTLKPMIILMRASEYAAENTPREERIEEYNISKQKKRYRQRAGLAWPVILEKLDDKRWEHALAETKELLESLNIDVDANYNFHPIWPI